jgi:hypothetical protein
MGFATL